MTEAIDNLGDLRGPGSVAGIGGQRAGGGTGWGKPLGSILSTLAQEFGAYSSPEEIAVLLAGIRLLVGAGLPAVDVADAMYGSPRVVDELRDGTPQAAKRAAIEHLSAALNELRAAAEPVGEPPDSGIPETSLRMMTAAGFAAGEIASALRSDATLREAMMQSDLAQLRQMLPSLHEMFHDHGRSTHADPAMLAALGARALPETGAAQGAWFEPYMSRIRAAQKRAIGELRPEDHPELMLVSAPIPEPVEEDSRSFGAWVIAAMLLLTALLFILSRC
ncbi:MAG: hypothetical protein WA532_01375 [Candidatus Korobacteraceae bacterium]